MREYKVVMVCVRSGSDDDSLWIIRGHVVDESMGDANARHHRRHRLGQARVNQQKPVLAYEQQQRTGTHDAIGVDYRELEMPAVMRTNRHVKPR